MSQQKSMPKVYTIPSGVPFIEVLIDGLYRGELISRMGQTSYGASQSTILLPTRRACRSLRNAFVNSTEQKALLLPKILPLGDLDDDDEPNNRLYEVEGAGSQTLSQLRRQLMLSRLVIARDTADSNESSEPRLRNLEHSLVLAHELATFLDQMQSARIDFKKLNNLAPDRYAQHWQKILEFLRILVNHWPNILSENKLLDIGEYRNLTIQNLGDRWTEHPPLTPVIAAGSTGSLPATADLLSVISRLPSGMVVLPGLDLEMHDKDWSALGISHPQYGLKYLLNTIGISREDVITWPSVSTEKYITKRQTLISDAMSPPGITESSQRRLAYSATYLRKFGLCECPNLGVEAGVIAIRLRKSLEHIKHTAALVTSDRKLARRVAVELQRWNITIDDSAGISVGKTAPGTFIRLTAALMSGKVTPISFLEALKHPFSSAGETRKMFLDKVRAIELAVLRGPRPSPGLLGIQRALELKSEDKLAKWVSEFRLAIGFTKVSTNEKLPLSDLLRAHISFADWLSSSKDKGQSKSIWLGDPGEALAMFIKELLNVAEESPQLTLSEYPAYLDALLKNEVVRPRYGKHPRLFIWSPLEARLQYVDLMILGGLNEGTWPPEADSDPWMSHSMREELGLPPHERRIGLSAHDFVQCCGAPEVMLTRSQNIDGEPTVPSRWLLRIKTLLQTNSLNESFEKASHQWLWLQSLMDRPEVPAKASIPPKPCPPIEARPRKLSVTQIETWLRNPYEIYASHILHLRPIDSIDADPSAADKGTVIHDILYHFLHEFGTRLPSNAFDRLLEIGREKFNSFEGYPSLMAFWWPRFERVAKWFIEYETEWRKSAIPLGGEVSGSLTISAPKGDFVIYAKADRIDQFADGGLVIIDYKTGSVPSDRLVRSGRYPQLPIEALIAETGGFNGISVEKVKCLAYLQLTGGQPAGKARFIKENIDTTIACTKKGLIDLINKFDDVTTPYSSLPSTDAKISWNNYAHLERFQEWFSREIGDA